MLFYIHCQSHSLYMNYDGVIMQGDDGEVRRQLSGCWAFEMMTSAVIVTTPSKLSCSLLHHRPYTVNGATTITHHHDASHGGCLTHHLELNEIFPEKYESFHGAVVNITAMDYPPYWIEPETADASSTFRSSEMPFGGADAKLLAAVAAALNFSVRILPTSSWKQTAELVSRRESLLTSVEHYIYPDRLQLHDFSTVYHVSSLAFGLAEPQESASWLTLFAAFTPTVWQWLLLALLAAAAASAAARKSTATPEAGATSVIINQAYNADVTNVTASVCSAQRNSFRIRTLDFVRLWGGRVLIMFATTLGQGGAPSDRSGGGKLLLCCWLLCSLILTTAYSSSFSARLTLPQRPARLHTLQDIVRSGV
ncbi:Ionotropic receptor 125, partial [Hyalella azteca]